MAWQMPGPGQWNPGVLTPDPSALNLAGMNAFTPDPWTLMQQQNWQQWAQWQQQYAQWHTQYGDKYAEQMQGMATMEMMPPQPKPIPPPAPPPPEKPPPPPHENDQPLYSKPQPPSNLQSNQSIPFNSNISKNVINNNSDTHKWSLHADLRHEKPLPTTSSVNNEALKKLAEEERLFDIQFRKWEEEIANWKKENINHPDKHAYSEYEQKFEACRAQLLERHKQMNQKRASLMSNIRAPQNLISSSKQIPNLINHSSQISKQSQTYKNQCSEYIKCGDDFRSKNINIVSQDQSKSFQDHHNFSSSRSNGKLPQDTAYVIQGVQNSNFLPTSKDTKGIPGLDLVPDGEKASQHEVIDITDEKSDTQTNVEQNQTGPDYSTISQGINNILGDAKIMNILSMVQNQNPNVTASMAPNTMPQDEQWNRSLDNKPGIYRTQDCNYNNRPPFNSYNNITESSYNMRNPPHNNFGNRQLPQIFYDNRPPRFYNYDKKLVPTVSINGIRPPGPNIYENKPAPNSYDNRIPNTYRNRPSGLNNYEKKIPDPNNFGNRPPNMGQPNVDMRENDFNKQVYQDNNMQMPHSNYQKPNPCQTQVEYDQGYIEKMDKRPRPLLEINTGLDNIQIANFDQTHNIPASSKPPWSEDPLFTPSIIVEYEHKSLRLKAREFIEPVHTFDYDHKSKDEDKKKDFEKEVVELFTRKQRGEKENSRRYRDYHTRDYERRSDILPEDIKAKPEHYVSREDRSDDKRHDERDRYRRDEYRDRERDVARDRVIRGRERDFGRDSGRDRDYGRDLARDRERDAKDRIRDSERDKNRSRSREREQRKRASSVNNEVSNPCKKSKTDLPRHIVMIDDLLEEPGRSMRPERIVIILRGPPGSGKSYLAKLIRDKEAEHGSTVRIMSIDDYFMHEDEVEEKDSATGKVVKKRLLKYDYDEQSEEVYTGSLKRAFKRTITDGYFSFLIFDAVNDQLRSYADIWSFCRQRGFQVYICTMDLDPQVCFKRNIHNRKLEDIEVICARFFSTPLHHIVLDPTTLLQNAAITEVTMEDAVSMEDVQEIEPSNISKMSQQVEGSFTSKWERMDDANQLARLDGTSKPLRAKLSMEDYLQLDEWTPNKAKPGKKTVRWADIEERREQEKIRAIGFVVGQTDWNRMTDPTMGSGALTKTKYIERVRRQ